MPRPSTASSASADAGAHGHLVTNGCSLWPPGGDLKYQRSGGATGTDLQVTDYLRERAYRQFLARGVGNADTAGNVYGNVPLNAWLRGRLHNDSGRTFTGSVYVWGDGYRYTS